MNQDLYTIAVWYSKQKASAQSAALIYNKIRQGNLEDLQATTDIAEFLTEILKKHPAVEPLAANATCPWADAFTTTDCYAILPLKREWGELVKLLLNTALKHNLTYYDPQTKQVYHPFALLSWLKKLRQHVMP